MMRLPLVGVILLFPGSFSQLTGPTEVKDSLGGSVSVRCRYDEGYQKNYQKYWCRGADWSSCITVIETTGSELVVKKGRVSIADNHTRSTFTVTMEELTWGDAGIYWCGITKVGADPGFQVNVIVLPEPSHPHTTAPVTTGYSSTASTGYSSTASTGYSSTASTAAVPTSSFFTRPEFLLPISLLMLVMLLLLGAVFLARRMKMKKKEKKAHETIPSPHEAPGSTEDEISYAVIKPELRGPSSTAGHAAPRPSDVEYATIKPGNSSDVSYTTVQFSTLEDQPGIYVNMDQRSHPAPRSIREKTEYCDLKTS
uniref:Ig-like domain-containing protein n=1 Tax=Sphenodon punctatus TaxID=8508 RepID=A0A8D0GYJ3_SPHPU